MITSIIYGAPVYAGYDKKHLILGFVKTGSLILLFAQHPTGVGSLAVTVYPRLVGNVVDENSIKKRVPSLLL